MGSESDGVYFFSNNEFRFEAGFLSTIHKFEVTWKEIALELMPDSRLLHHNQVAPEGRGVGET